MKETQQQLHWGEQIKAAAVAELADLANDLAKAGQSEASAAAHRAAHAVAAQNGATWFIYNRMFLTVKAPHPIPKDRTAVSGCWGPYSPRMIRAHVAFSAAWNGLKLREEGQILLRALEQLAAPQRMRICP